MTRDTRTQLLAGACLLASIAGLAVTSIALTESVGQNKLAYTEVVEEGAPPQVALGIAMGAFRGIFVNFLWMRANDLKEAGRYYEAMDLASTITKLQPRFPQVWAFHAWNMAYNISVMTQTPEERWHWVQSGIRLLRDQGVPANPSDLLVHKELAWIYLHKIQGYTDDANPYYKRRHAQEWNELLGDPPRPDPLGVDRAGQIRAYVDWLKPIADAPDSLAKDEPLARELWDRLKSEAQVTTDNQLCRRFAVHEEIRQSGQRALLEAGMSPKFTAMKALIDDPKYASTWPKLLAMARKRVLVHEYRMEPARMIRYTQKYGPIDWRHPAAHALYWSARGVEEALLRVSESNEKDYDFLNVDRLVMQSLQELWRSGELYYDTLGGQYVTMPDPYFIEGYGNVVGEVVERSWADKASRVYSFYSAGYENFLIDVVRFLYRRGQLEEANRYYDKLRLFPGQNLNDPARSERFAKPLPQFVTDEVWDRYTSPSVAQADVMASLQGAFASLLAGNDEAFRRQRDYAIAAHKYFFDNQFRLTVASGEWARLESYMSRDFSEVAGLVFNLFLGVLSIDDAERLYGRADDGLKLYAYDALAQRFRESLDQAGAAGGRKFDLVFPPPPGLEAFREAIRQRQEAADREAPAVAPK